MAGMDDGLGGALASVLTPAAAIAASPFTIIPAILLLLTPRAAANGGAFLVGWVLGLVTAATAFVLLAGVVERVDNSPVWLSWTRMLLGALLVGWGARLWFTRTKPKPTPAWMARISDATPRRAFRLAVILALANPKVLLLTVAAGLAIGSAELTGAETIVAIAVFTVVASLTVLVPLGLYLVLGERMLRPLSAARDWLERNNAAVMAVVLVVIGLQLVLKGASDIA